MDYGERALQLHKQTHGKVAIRSKMPLRNQDDLSLAYTPGVGTVSSVIAKDKKLIYDYTAKGNLVAVVSDGSAVLGLGNLGPEGAMPVMEGKAILFKELADIDAFPICLATQDSQEIIKTVKYLTPTFGGFNLEDISAPRCFEIEEALQDIGVPVFHDDQHGTAIVVTAALLNALKVVDKELRNVKVVISGAGASAVAVTKLLMGAGARHVILLDTKGVIHKGRKDLNWIKQQMSEVTNPEGVSGGLSEAMRGADVFIGLSAAGLVNGSHVKLMGKKAIVFAMANPVPEIMPDEANAAGAAVVGTGRSDFPNQINNVLAFPGVFRGALDVRASKITPRMKRDASLALSALVEEPDPTHILPFALDRKVVPAVASAVANAWKAETQQPAGAKKG